MGTNDTSPGVLKLGGAPPLGGVKASQGGREHDSDILMKNSSKLQSHLVFLVNTNPID